MRGNMRSSQVKPVEACRMCHRHGVSRVPSGRDQLCVLSGTGLDGTERDCKIIRTWTEGWVRLGSGAGGPHRGLAVLVSHGREQLLGWQRKAGSLEHFGAA